MKHYIFVRCNRHQSLYILKYFQGKGKSSKLDAPFPNTIEDVPFRRQDRRILNARKKRLSDRRLYKCIMLTGILILIFGACLITLYILWKLEFLGKYGVAEMVFSQQLLKNDKIFKKIISIYKHCFEFQTTKYGPRPTFSHLY